MLSKLQTLITDLIEKNTLYSLIVTYSLAVITCLVIVVFFKSVLLGEAYVDPELSDGFVEQSVGEETSIFVEISGAIKKPGVFELEGGSRVVELVKTAGGFEEGASEEWISRYVNMSNVLLDSQKIYIPYKWDDLDRSEESKIGDIVELVKPYTVNIEEATVTGDNDGSGQGTGAALGSTSSSLININTASQEDIDALPGIGPVYAARFIENRPYVDLEDLKEKSGVSESVVEKIKDSIAY